MVLEALDGTPGTPREIVTLNGGVALYTSGLSRRLGRASRGRKKAIASGAPVPSWTSFVGVTRRLAAS